MLVRWFRLSTRNPRKLKENRRENKLALNTENLQIFPSAGSIRSFRLYVYT